MIVYSVSYREGRSSVERHMWFATEREADDWAHDNATRYRDKYGPHKHVISGKAGLLSFLNTYRSK